MMSRRYVKMRGRPRGRRPGCPALLEPLYETERKAMTAEMLGRRSRTTDGDLRERDTGRPGAQVAAPPDR